MEENWNDKTKTWKRYLNSLRDIVVILTVILQHILIDILSFTCDFTESTLVQLMAKCNYHMNIPGLYWWWVNFG